MTDRAEAILDRLYDLIEYRTGHRIADYPDAVDALDNLLSHEAATGTIPRHGMNWFSQEDRIALHGKTRPSQSDYSTFMPNLIPQFLAASAHCRDGAEFSGLIAQALLAAHDQIADLQKRVLDHANRTIPERFIFETPKGDG
jgi:hypothetical protein